MLFVLYIYKLLWFLFCLRWYCYSCVLSKGNERKIRTSVIPFGVVCQSFVSHLVWTEFEWYLHQVNDLIWTTTALQTTWLYSFELNVHLRKTKGSRHGYVWKIKFWWSSLQAILKIYQPSSLSSKMFFFVHMIKPNNARLSFQCEVCKGMPSLHFGCNTLLYLLYPRNLTRL